MVNYFFFRVENQGETVTSKDDKYPKLYQNLSQYRNMSLLQALTVDMKCCFEIEPAVVGFLCPSVFGWYETEVLGAVDIFRLLVASLDGFQLQDVVWRIAQCDLVIFDAHYIATVICKFIVICFG